MAYRHRKWSSSTPFCSAGYHSANYHSASSIGCGVPTLTFLQLVNKCGSGEAVFLYADEWTPLGSTTISGPLAGGVAWVSGLDGANCLNSGVNCGTVEFSLLDGSQNSINYSLQSEGNHV